MSDPTRRGRPGGGDSGWRFVLISLFIVGLLGLQAMVGFGLNPGPVQPPPYLWPILNYPMYAGSALEGDRVSQYTVLGVRADGSRVRIAPADFGLGTLTEDYRTPFWLYREGPVAALRENDRERARFYRGVYERRTGSRLVELVLVDEPAVIEEDGYRVLPERSIASIVFDTSASESGLEER